MDSEEDRKLEKKIKKLLPEWIDSTVNRENNGGVWHYTTAMDVFFRKSSVHEMEQMIVRLLQEEIESRGWYWMLTTQTAFSCEPDLFNKIRLMSRWSFVTHLPSLKFNRYFILIQGKPFNQLERHIRSNCNIIYMSLGKIFREEECVICRDSAPDILLVCGHLLICRNCWAVHQISSCPMCRKPAHVQIKPLTVRMSSPTAKYRRPAIVSAH